MSDKKRGMLFILSGPSGSGKDTILEQLAKRDPNVQLSISLTTRAARDWEIDGFHYYFVTKDYFLNKLERQEILEYAQYGEQYYGTPRDPVDQWLEEGKTGAPRGRMCCWKSRCRERKKSAGYIRMW